MAKKVSLKAFLKCAERKQQVRLVIPLCLDAQSEPDFPIVYCGEATKTPKEYESNSIWFWGIREDDTLLIMLGNVEKKSFKNLTLAQIIGLAEPEHTAIQVWAKGELLYEGKYYKYPKKLSEKPIASWQLKNGLLIIFLKEELHI